MKMTRLVFMIAAALVLALPVCAKGFWSFGKDEEKSEKREPRLSEIIEPVSVLIDTASDHAATGAVDQAVATYRKALKELDRIEREYPERVKTPEFATVRNKRAYIDAAINALHFEQADRNAKAVAVSDTSELERKLRHERERERVYRAIERLPVRQRHIRKTIELMADGRLKEAASEVERLYKVNTNDTVALNLRAAVAMANGRFKSAASDLGRAIDLDPMDHTAYYNLARLLLRPGTNEVANARRREKARGYYEDGRALGGPKVPALERRFAEPPEVSSEDLKDNDKKGSKE